MKPIKRDVKTPHTRLHTHEHERHTGLIKMIINEAPGNLGVVIILQCPESRTKTAPWLILKRK